MPRKMKMNGKLKTIVKNDIEFIRIMAKHDKDFWIFVDESRKIVGLEPLDRGDFIQWRRILNLKSGDWESNWGELVTYWKDSQTEMLRIISNAKKDQRLNFIKKIEEFRIKNDLTIDWDAPLLTLFTTGFFMPPMFNLSFESSNKETITMEINSSTKLSDIKEAWDMIETSQKELKQYDRKNNTTNSGKNLFEYINYLNESITKFDEDIVEKTKYKLHDIDWVLKADIPKTETGEDDIKAVNRIRKRKSRLNKPQK